MKQKTDIVVDLSAYRKDLEQTQQKLEFYRNDGTFNTLVTEILVGIIEQQGKALTFVEDLVDISKGQQRQIDSLTATIMTLESKLEELNDK